MKTNPGITSILAAIILFSILTSASTALAGAQKWIFKSNSTPLSVCDDSIGIFKLIKENHGRAIDELQELPFEFKENVIVSTPSRSVLVQVDDRNIPILLIDNNGETHSLVPTQVQHGLCPPSP